MNLPKSSTWIIFLIFVLGALGSDQIPASKVVEIEPIAFEVIVPHYSRIVTLFTDDAHWSQYVPLFEEKANQIMQQPSFKNTTLFAICNTSKDVSRTLSKYGPTNSIKIVSPIKYYELTIPSSGIQHFFSQQFTQKYRELVNPLPPIFPPAQLQHEIKDEYAVVIFPSNNSQLEQTKIIYEQSLDYLSLFQVSLYVGYDQKLEDSDKNTQIFVFKDGKKYSQYPTSAIKALYNFTNFPSNHEINDFMDFINIETIDLVSKLNHDNYYRIFGSQLDSQLLLIYYEKSQNTEELTKVREIFKAVADYNKQEQLKSHRVLFAEATVEFLSQYFADDILTDPSIKYKIIFTKTEYSTFQLRKYEYKSSQIDQEKLKEFIQDVRLKRAKATYKSEAIPQENNQKFRKIVGNSFISEIFEQKNKSVIVLFVDSKNQEEYNEVMKVLEEFTGKYHEAYKELAIISYFDLAKNQHELLTIRNSPQLVIFDKANKKQPRFFRGKFTPEIIKNWMNYEIKDLVIPQNFGEPLLPLGGASNTDL